MLLSVETLRGNDGAAPAPLKTCLTHSSDPGIGNAVSFYDQHTAALDGKIQGEKSKGGTDDER
jgi:hypothetical protein